MPGVERGTIGNRWDTAPTEAFSDGVFAAAVPRDARATALLLDLLELCPNVRRPRRGAVMWRRT